MNKIAKVINKIIDNLTVALFIVLLLIGIYAIYDSYKIGESAKLSDDILNLIPEEDNFSLDELQKINKDIIGWIKIDNTNIDYPILKGKDNSEYLDLNYKKEAATAGSIFVDYRNDDFNDNYIVTYGHNMSSGQMYSNVKLFANKDYFDSHPTGMLYTSLGRYKIDIYAYGAVDAYKSEVYNLIGFKNESTKNIINYFDTIVLNKRNLEFNDNKIIILSTCDAFGSNDRDIIIARLTFEGENKDTFNPNSNEIDKNNRIVSKVNKEKFKINVSIREVALLILLISVIIIYIILIIKRLKSRK